MGLKSTASRRWTRIDGKLARVEPEVHEEARVEPEVHEEARGEPEIHEESGVQHETHEESSSDDYDSTEDEVYKPGAELFEDEEEDLPVVAKRRKGKCTATSKTQRHTSGDKGKGIVHEVPEVDEEEHGEYTNLEGSSSEDGDSDLGEDLVEDTHVGGMTFADDDNDGYHSKGPDHLPLSEEEQDEHLVSKYPKFNANAEFGDVQLQLGMEFKSLDEFKQAVKDYNIHLGREYRYKKNDSIRCRAKCVGTDCPWEILCSWSNTIGCFQIKTFKDNHTCARGFKVKKANSKWVAKELVKEVRSHPQMITPDAFNWLKQNRGVLVDYFLVYRGLKRARRFVEGSEKEQYNLLWDYTEELLQKNPGSTIKLGLKVVDPSKLNTFHRLYICLEACKRGFKLGRRLLIGLDGCFLKGYYGGQLLAAIAQDGNNSPFVIAYAFVDAETKESWKWFLELLHDDLGDYKENGWNFISDQQKGLIPALQEVMPGVNHRFCVRHLWVNFHKQWKNADLNSLLW